MLNYVRGETTSGSDDDKLYNMMPLNARLALQQRAGNWTNTLEAHLVSAKTELSHIRNELPTAGYGLLNLRSSYEWKMARLDIGVENVLNTLYAPHGRRSLRHRGPGRRALGQRRGDGEVLIRG